MEGIAALLGSENESRYRGGVAATVTPVALHCATKVLHSSLGIEAHKNFSGGANMGVLCGGGGAKSLG